MDYTNDIHTNTPIKSKSAYLKLLFLKDQEKHKEKPAFYKSIHGSTQPVYDSAVLYFFVLYGIDKPQPYAWYFANSSDGSGANIDDVFQLYPIDSTRNDVAHSENPNVRARDRIIIPKTDGIVAVAHYYNAFQRQVGEWTGTRAEKDVLELRFVVDFSSIITIPGKESLLFKTKPTTSMQDPRENISKAIELDYDSDRIFSATANNVPEGAVLQFKWQLNWDNLGTWQGFAGEQGFTPTIYLWHYLK
jgi:hypothetical protein